jgi:hypothetical protein
MKRRSNCIRVLGQLALLCAIVTTSSSTSAGAAAPDIVLYASDVSVFAGMRLETDSTAAGGRKLASSDNGWASTAEPPPASSAPVATFVFEVPTTANYRVWLRMKGKGNSKWNESVWVQFDRSSRYHWGTNDALLVNLENCSACGIQEWGWQDNSWWLNQFPIVTLGAGFNRIFVSLREDGVEFDQIVLSPERFLTTAPGPVKNDNTILMKSTDERITIQRGTFVLDEGGAFSAPGQFNLSGSNGFVMGAHVTTLGRARGVLTSCDLACPPGQEEFFWAHWVGGDVTPHVLYRGASYAPNGLNPDDFSLIHLLVDGFVKMPAVTEPAEGQRATASAQFTFGTVFDYRGDPGEPTGRALLVGGGTVTFTFQWSTVDQGWLHDGASFRFIDPSGEGAPPGTEVVLYASDVTSLAGLSLVDDSTAAGGTKISSTDSGRQWLNSPPPLFEAPNARFDAYVPETGNYRVWLRLKGQANSKWNESVWVQFRGAMRNGAPVYQWGSSSGLLVNLEDCSNCGIQEWGWQDNSWWLNQSSLVELSEGVHTLFVSLREDGVEFDQIVLSRQRYVSAPPGPVKNDRTIVEK